MKMLKRLLIIAATVVMLCVISVVASAETYGDLTYTVTNGEVTITGCDASVTAVNIPSEIDGYPVRIIGKYAFYNCSSMSSILIPDSIINIGYYSFYNCRSLEYIFYTGTQNDWNNIHKNLFYNVFSTHTKTIYYNVDEHYLAIDNVLFNKTGTMLVVYGQGKKLYAVPDEVKSIERNAFSYKNIHTVILPEKLKYIGVNAFYNATNLTSIYIPASTSTIDENAFYGCSNLSDVYFGGTESQWNELTINSNNSELESSNVYFNSKLILENGAVYTSDKKTLVCYDNSKAETSFTIPKTITTIETGAFKDCNNLKEIILSDGLNSIQSNAFCNCSQLQQMIIPNNVTNIGSNAFRNCYSLISIIISDNITNIANATFYDCKSLESVTLGNSIEKIGDNAFENCEALSSISFPESLTDIGESAFASCNGLTYISLPDSITSLGNGVFKNCTNLEKICLPEGNLATIPAKAFNGCVKLTEIYIPANITAFGDSAFYGCNQLSDIYFGGTEEEWNKISIVSSNSVIWAANVHFNHKHSLSNWTTLIPVQKYTDGLKASKCTVCGYEERQIIPCNHAHNYKCTIITKPTCTTDGLGNYTCECSKSYTEAIKATGHTKATVKGYAATCTKAGITDGIKCSICDEILSAQTTINATWHTKSTVKGYSATCTKSGLTDGAKCSVCDEILTLQKEMPALSHGFGEWTVVTAPTASAEGKEERTCTACDEKETRAIEKLGGMIGDINGDNEITAADARLALRISAGLETLESVNTTLEMVDYNGDKQITAADARLILRKSAGLE